MSKTEKLLKKRSRSPSPEFFGQSEKCPKCGGRMNVHGNCLDCPYTEEPDLKLYEFPDEL